MADVCPGAGIAQQIRPPNGGSPDGFWPKDGKAQVVKGGRQSAHWLQVLKSTSTPPTWKETFLHCRGGRVRAKETKNDRTCDPLIRKSQDEDYETAVEAVSSMNFEQD